MQTPQHCRRYTHNKNFNLTCNGEDRCTLLANSICYKFEPLQDCTECEHLNVETIYGVCNVYGILNRCRTGCPNFMRGKDETY